VEINGYFLLQETIVKCEHVVNGTEWCGVNKNVLLQKGLEIFVRLVLLIVVFQFDDVIILFSMPQLVTEFVNVPIGVN
jgi:hypothetical protein